MDGIARERSCSKVGCTVDAVGTLTYVYDDATAVLGPLAYRPEPHSYDLCARHAERLSVPQGWTVLRYSVPEDLTVPALPLDA